jgi:hypothetical protein
MIGIISANDISRHELEKIVIGVFDSDQSTCGFSTGMIERGERKRTAREVSKAD